MIHFTGYEHYSTPIIPSRPRYSPDPPQFPTNSPNSMECNRLQPPKLLAADLRIGRHFIRWNIGFWLILAAIGGLIRLGITQSPSWALALTVLQDSIAFCLSFALWLILRRWFPQRPFDFSGAVMITLLSLAAALANAALSHVFIEAANWVHPTWGVVEGALYRVTFFWLAFMLWSCAWVAFSSWQRMLTESHRATRAEADAAAHELRMLRSRLAPHFLCNALNGITTMVRPDPDSARQMLCELADYLRYSLEQNQLQMVALEEEFTALKHYLRIEKARFGDQLQIDTQLDPAVAKTPVPGFILQPLVENAVKYGSAGEGRGKGTVAIHAVADGDAVRITVRNDGQLEAGDKIRDGVGLSIVRRCLELHYPQRHDFSLNSDVLTVTATIRIHPPL